MSAEPFTITTCPNCGSRSIRKARRDWHGEVRGCSYVVPKLEYYECPKCGETVYPPQAMRKIEAHSPAHRRQRRLRA